MEKTFDYLSRSKNPNSNLGEILEDLDSEKCSTKKDFEEYMKQMEERYREPSIKKTMPKPAQFYPTAPSFGMDRSMPGGKSETYCPRLLNITCNSQIPAKTFSGPFFQQMPQYQARVPSYIPSQRQFREPREQPVEQLPPQYFDQERMGTRTAPREPFFPHTYFPFPKASPGFPMMRQKTLEELMEERKNRRTNPLSRSPYQRGYIEDALEPMESSLLKNEVMAIRANQAPCGFEPYKSDQLGRSQFSRTPTHFPQLNRREGGFNDEFAKFSLHRDPFRPNRSISPYRTNPFTS